jgi:hypothetical protein
MSAFGPSIVTALGVLFLFPSAESTAQLASSAARGAILVQVTDTSINPLPADVTLPRLGLGVRLSEDGTALVVNVPDGLYIVQARHRGHIPESQLLRVSGDTARVELVLSPADQHSQKVDARAGGAIARARLRSFMAWSMTLQPGKFVARSESQRARTMSSLLRGLNDIRVERVRGRTTVHAAQARGPHCADGMLIFLDGNALRPSDVPRPAKASVRYWSAAYSAQTPPQLTAGGARTNGSEVIKSVAVSGGGLVHVALDPAGVALIATQAPRVTDIDRIDMSSVVAIEIYLTADAAPPEFQERGAQCGVLSIWTTGA